jgi:hypothetical protein
MPDFTSTYDPSAPASAAISGASASNREDLTDVLTILAPEETPVLSSANRQGASSTFVEWTVDSLATPSTTGISEGADVVFGAQSDVFSGRARLGNYIQKFRRDYKVSDLQEAVDSVGPAKIAQAEAKAIRELKRDIEATLCSTNDLQAETGSVPYKLRGLGSWISSDAQATSPVPVDYRTPADSIYTQAEATANPFSESKLNDIITSMFRVTGSTNSLMLVADTALRREISDFARVLETGVNDLRKVNYVGGDAEIKVSVDLYQSDHGVISIVNMNPDCSPNTTDKDVGYIVNPEYYGIHELIPMGSTRLPNQGGGERGYVDCALTLGVYHPGAHGKIDAIA